MKRFALLFTVLVLLQACVTAYQPSGFGGGYTDIQLCKNAFKVSFRGNRYTSKERAVDFALLRCSELTLQHQYNFFSIVNTDSYSEQSLQTTPTTSTTTVSALSSGHWIQGKATTTTTGGETLVISEPTETNTIVCFKQKPNDIFTYDALIVLKNIAQKYGLQTNLRDDSPKKPVAPKYEVFNIEATPLEKTDEESPDSKKPAVERLKELQELKDSGLITDHEYQKKRSEIIDNI